MNTTVTGGACGWCRLFSWRSKSPLCSRDYSRAFRSPALFPTFEEYSLLFRRARPGISTASWGTHLFQSRDALTDTQSHTSRTIWLHDNRKTSARQALSRSGRITDSQTLSVCLYVKTPYSSANPPLTFIVRPSVLDYEVVYVVIAIHAAYSVKIVMPPDLRLAD